MADYKCFAYPSPVFGPAMRLIASITNAEIPVVTTTFDHGYPDNTIVRFDIPPACGMQQLNQQTSRLLVASSNSFLIEIDTTTFEPFSVPVGMGPFVDICAQVVPIGSANRTLEPAVKNQL